MDLNGFENAMKKNEEDFIKVKKFLEENPQATAYDVSDKIEVSHRQIMKWIDEGRLEMKSGMGMGIIKPEANILQELNGLKDDFSKSSSEENSPKRRTGMYVTSKK